jgi:hypothetical protein
MESIFYRQKSDEGCISSAWRYPFPEESTHERLIIGEDRVDIFPDESFPDESTGSGSDDRHISVETEVRECCIFYFQKYLDHISTDPIVFAIAYTRIFHDPFIGRILRVFYDETISVQIEEVTKYIGKFYTWSS